MLIAPELVLPDPSSHARSVPRDLLPLFTRPYNQWAPYPYNNRANTADSGANLFSFAFSGQEEIFNLLGSLMGTSRDGGGRMRSLDELKGFAFLDHKLSFLQSRVWGGLVPMSDRRWADKNLDAIENFYDALEHLEAALVPFAYLNSPERTEMLRNAYNSAHGHLAHFDNALEAYRAAGSGGRARVNGGFQHIVSVKVADLWTEYFFTTVTLFCNRTHTWIKKRVDKLYAIVTERVTLTEPDANGNPTPYQYELAKRFGLLQGVMHKADCLTLLSLNGYKNTTGEEKWDKMSSPPQVDFVTYALRSGELPLRPGVFSENPDTRLRIYKARIRCVLKDVLVAESQEHGPTTGEMFGAPAILRRFRVLLAASERARAELRSSVTFQVVTEEPWITFLKGKLRPPPPGSHAPVYNKWGFIGYRVYHGHTDDEWKLFLEKFKTDVVSWGEGVLGAEEIKSKCKIRWIDSREIEGANSGGGNNTNAIIAAARGHFKSLRDDRNAGMRGLLAPEAFLVADKATIDSYLYPTTLPGQKFVDASDLGGFVRVASGGGEGQPADASRPESHEFDGTVRVRGSVLFDDFFAAVFSRAIRVMTFWPIARAHPDFVYTGPAAGYQEEGWRRMHAVKDECWKAAKEFVTGNTSGGSSGGSGDGGGTVGDGDGDYSLFD
ncbi:hypothetical protein QBC35DRAFT_394933 [Podospora australis]|uniref:Uncharacterized protein n=1 Tax=Podospora australis TaxID=1536484 RepID=A0AAN6WJB5_9PEZI|nr:hypothetical protein QBC35DRAFT_394933 [Podospora australis]